MIELFLVLVGLLIPGSSGERRQVPGGVRTPGRVPGRDGEAGRHQAAVVAAEEPIAQSPSKRGLGSGALYRTSKGTNFRSSFKDFRTYRKLSK